MAYLITDRCYKCGACVYFCPAEAIAFSQAKDRFVIAPEKCVECGQCTAVCPWGATMTPLEQQREAVQTA